VNPQPTRNARLGFILALSTMLFWATLAVAMKIALKETDAVTLTWFRFAFSAVATGIWMVSRGQLGQFRGVQRQEKWLLAFAFVMLLLNYLGYVYGLKFTTPANAQLLIQLGPLLLALGGVVLFKEQLGALRIAGFVAIACGLLLFFADQKRHVVGAPQFLLGGVIIALAAATWAAYGLAQKKLLGRFSAQGVLLVIYLGAAITLLPLVNFSSLAMLSGAAWIAVMYCALNTLAAYSAFAEALGYWEASRVSAVLACTPIFTIIFVWIMHKVMPERILPEHIGWIGWLGALLVVTGSVTASLAMQSKNKPEKIAA
jgi:drug/metabolite transporter (DMT)-like permease